MKIHPKLEEQLLIIHNDGEACGSPISYNATKNDRAALIYNKEKVVLLTIEELPTHWAAQPFIVDVAKWAWAEAEGFNRDEIWKDKALQKMIFSPVNRAKLYKYFGIS